MSLPLASSTSRVRNTGMSWSPPLPIWARTSSWAVTNPKSRKVSTQAAACRSTVSINVPSMSKMTAFGMRPNLDPAARLAPHGGADVGADLVEVRTGVLEIPFPPLGLPRRDDHGDEDESAEKREKKHDEPHGAFPTWVRGLPAREASTSGCQPRRFK